MLWVLSWILELLKWLIIIRALMSWFVDPFSDNPLVTAVRKVTDPILRPFEEMMPDLGGINVAPLLAYFAITLLQMVVARVPY